MTQIRVLRLIARMNVGGAAQEIAGLQRGLSDRFQSVLVTGEIGRGEEDFISLRAPDIEIVRLPGLGRDVETFGDLRALREFRDMIRDFRPHIVHTHTAKAGVLGRVAAFTTGVPATVHTFHGHLLKGYFSDVGTRAVTVVERALARRTTRLLAVGRQVRDDLLAAGVGHPGQYVVMPPGVWLPDAPSQRRARQELGIPEGVPIVSYVGRLARVKRPDRFLRVVRLVSAKIPDAVFLVAGGGELTEAVTREVEQAGTTAVRFLGWRSDIERIHAASDLTLLTSDNEGMPVSLIEAGLLGRPAVATNVGSVSEVVDHGRSGLIGVSDSELAAHVTDLISNDDLRRQMGRVAKERCRELFSMQRLIEQTQAVYDDVMSDVSGEA